MARTLKDLLDEARARRDTGRPINALKVYRLVMEAAPLDFDLRLEIGDLLGAVGAGELSTPVFTAVAEHNIKAGNPLGAMVAVKLLEQRNAMAEPLVQSLKERYSFGSNVLGRSVTLAPTDYSQTVREDVDLDYAVDDDAFLAQTAEMAAHTASIENYPALVPPLAIFSALEKEAFGELFGHLVLKRYSAGAPVVSQGDPGESVYFIARGEVDVVKRKEGTDRTLHLARLGPGSLFGEMALLSDMPRSASVIASTDVDALELSCHDVKVLAGRMPHVAGAMARFTRERMIYNLFATNPLFIPFKDDDKKRLLARFTGHDVPAGTIFLEQGDVGRGLYVVLQGKAEVLTQETGQPVKIADIGAGDIVGEMALINEAPVSATVRTTTKSTLLFLARELFQPLVENIPELKSYFKRLSTARAEDTQFKLMAERLSDDFVESVDDDNVELSDDDFVLI